MSSGNGSRGTRRTIRVIGIFLIASFIMMTGFVTVVYLLVAPAASNHAPGDLPAREERFFEVRPGEGLRAVSRNLAAEDLVRSALAVELFGRIRGYGGRLQAGRYLLSPAMSPVRIIAKIALGESIPDERIVTIPEGWSVLKVGDYLEAAELFSSERFRAAAVMQPAYRDITAVAPLEDGQILEGYLFPDTYRFAADGTPESLVRAMLTNLERKMTGELRTDIEAQGRTVRDVIILASIIQAEAGSVAEMRDVAGVFTKRLARRIPLESDATVNYALGTSRRQPTFADIRTDHPYNTYRNGGLPPGPIGNPGMDAIRAAIHPADNPYFFFLHKESGEIVLTRTFREHLDRKAKYLD